MMRYWKAMDLLNSHMKDKSRERKENAPWQN